MVTYDQYLINAKKNEFADIFNKNEWTVIYNQLRKNRIYFKRKDAINEVKIDNLLLQTELIHGRRIKSIN